MTAPHPADDWSAGQRVNYYRTLRGLTQEVLGGLIGRNRSWVCRVESDTIFPRPQQVMELARVLRVNPGDLVGGPYGGMLGDEPSGHPMVPSLRAALAGPYRSLPDNCPQEPTAASLKQQIRELWRYWQAPGSTFDAVAGSLPTLVRSGEWLRLHATGEDEVTVRAALIEIYGLVRQWSGRVGESTLRYIAGDRAMRVAEELDDPALIGLAGWHLMVCYRADGDHDTAAAVAAQTMGALAPLVDENEDVAAMYGQLNLAAMITAARTYDERGARRMLATAGEIADRLATEAPRYGTAFGPSNVEIHRPALELELGHATEAIRIGEKVDPTTSPSVERRQRHYLDLARAYNTRRDVAGCLMTLLRAERTWEDGTRKHPYVREMVRDLLRRAPAAYHDEVQGLAVRTKVLAA